MEKITKLLPSRLLNCNHSDVLFRFDQLVLSGEAKMDLGKLVLVPDKYSVTDVEIQGHTGSKESKASSMFLRN